MSACGTINFGNTHGFTGMSIDAGDEYECPGCFSSSNGYIKYLKVEKGERYFLVVNNFTSSRGYTIDFCGNTSFSPQDTIVKEGCEGSIFNYNIFVDVNKNGIQDYYERIYVDPSLVIEAENDSYTVFGNNTKSSTSYLLPYGEYEALFPDKHMVQWELTTDNDTTAFSLNSEDPIFETKYGVFPLFDTLRFETYINHSNPRCNENSILSLYFNSITADDIDKGILWLENVDDLEILEYSRDPDTIQGTSVGWIYTDIQPNLKYLRRKITFVNPPMVDTNEVFLNFNSYFEVLDEDYEGISNGAYKYKRLLRCSYDPNDKLVTPNRKNNEIYEGEKLYYTIRFQNTGNDYAKDVVIKDQISESLDLGTFDFIRSSHDGMLTISRHNDEIDFSFNNIFLPDSTTNFDLSQGYVTFSIDPNNALKHGAAIENTANIYFDFNDPVITNTTLSVITDPDFIDLSPIGSLLLSSNPVSNILEFQLTTGVQDPINYLIYDNLGRIIDEGIFINSKLLDVSHYNIGIYYLVVNNKIDKLVKKFVKI